MRVLFWSLNFWPNIGGIEVLAARLVPDLRARGHQFLIVAPKTPPELPDRARYRNIPIHRLSFHNTVATCNIDQFVNTRQEIIDLKREFRPDLVHINGVGSASLYHLTTDHVYRAPLLVTLHGAWEPWNDTIVGHTLRAADWVAGCSAAILERGLRLAPEIAGHSSIIHNGIDPPPCAPKPLSFETPRILSLGRLSPEKGTDLALTAFASVVSRFPKARLTIAGDGPLGPALKQRAYDLGLERAVDFIGWVPPDGVPDLLNESTMVVMPSRHDSLPLSALEAGLMARPIVATRVGGIPEVVVHGETGLLVENEDCNALAEASLFLLSNPRAAADMGKAGRERALQLFAWERHVNAYDALYRELSQ